MDRQEHQVAATDFEALYQAYVACQWHGDSPVPLAVQRWLAVTGVLLEQYKQLAAQDGE